MKLSDLCFITASTLGFSFAEMTSVTRFLREARQISIGTKGGAGAASMSSKDMASVFVGCCGIGTARQGGVELPKWIERCPGLIEHIESCIKNPPVDTSVEFDVDGYCARFIRKDGKVKTFGKRPEAASYLTRTITAKAFRAWLEGLSN